MRLHDCPPVVCAFLFWSIAFLERRRRNEKHWALVSGLSATRPPFCALQGKTQKAAIPAQSLENFHAYLRLYRRNAEAEQQFYSTSLVLPNSEAALFLAT